MDPRRDSVHFGGAFRANGLNCTRLRTKYSLSELSRLIPGIPGMRGNGPNRAGPDLCSTRAGGKDDGS